MKAYGAASHQQKTEVGRSLQQSEKLKNTLGLRLALESSSWQVDVQLCKMVAVVLRDTSQWCLSSVGLMVGLHDLKGLSQPKHCYDSINTITVSQKSTGTKDKSHKNHFQSNKTLKILGFILRAQFSSKPKTHSPAFLGAPGPTCFLEHKKAAVGGCLLSIFMCNALNLTPR